MCKSRYNSSLRKIDIKIVCIKAIWEITDQKKYFD